MQHGLDHINDASEKSSKCNLGNVSPDSHNNYFLSSVEEISATDSVSQVNPLVTISQGLATATQITTLSRPRNNHLHALLDLMHYTVFGLQDSVSQLDPLVTIS
ncbi:hypothetical protein J6590_089447 [Homalodisca vitripennis]|nr:hypothetical protein J6590_089447 [Homalodisca vitripennis]